MTNDAIYPNQNQCTWSWPLGWNFVLKNICLFERGEEFLDLSSNNQINNGA